MDYTKGNWMVKNQRCARYWKAEVRTPDKKDENDGHVIEYGQLIAVFYGKNTVANAHLSSAAPDMYEALKHLPEPKSILADDAYNGGDVPKKWINNQGFFNDGYNQALKDTAKLREQALAKAEGKES